MPHSHGHACETEAGHHDHDHSPPPEETNQVQSLHQNIRHNAIRALNVKTPDSGSQVVKPWTERFSTSPQCESDSDEQLMIHIPFDGMVKLKSILIRSPATISAVKELRVYINREDLDFDTIADVKPTETFECVPYENASDLIEYPVKIRLYNNVKNITLFFVHNYSEDEEPTVIWYLGFRGDHTELKDAPIAISYEAFANPKDHKVDGLDEETGHLGV